MRVASERKADLATQIAVTMGDPAGIGPDIALIAWNSKLSNRVSPFFVIGDPDVFRSRATTLGFSAASVAEIQGVEQTSDFFNHALPVLPCGVELHDRVIPGSPKSAYAAAILESISTAVRLAQHGKVSGIVTGPIAKHVLLSQGFPHAGHTEYLGELASLAMGKPHTPVMLMASPRLNVIPVTVHMPFQKVAEVLTVALIRDTAEIAALDFARYFGMRQPRIAVCGLNPHAGEEGELGREEIDVIAPAIEILRGQGLNVTGPHSADSLFHDAARATYDLALAMYHDQALIPFKTLSFEDGVNVTLGLPFIRTSPDHGTAFSLAGTGRANPSSFICAVNLARTMSHHRHSADNAVSK